MDDKGFVIETDDIKKSNMYNMIYKNNFSDYKPYKFNLEKIELKKYSNAYVKE